MLETSCQKNQQTIPFQKGRRHFFKNTAKILNSPISRLRLDFGNLKLRRQSVGGWGEFTVRELKSDTVLREHRSQK